MTCAGRPLRSALGPAWLRPHSRADTIYVGWQRGIHFQQIPLLFNCCLLSLTLTPYPIKCQRLTTSTCKWVMSAYFCQKHIRTENGKKNLQLQQRADMSHSDHKRWKMWKISQLLKPILSQLKLWPSLTRSHVMAFFNLILWTLMWQQRPAPNYVWGEQF